MSNLLSGLYIRDCRADEVNAVLDLWRQADAIPGVTDKADDLRRAVSESPAAVLVAEVNGQLVGSIIGTFDGWRGNIYRLAVHPTYRRHGIARALVAEIEKRLAAQGTKRISALVHREHGWATGFWSAVGYDLDARIVRHVRSLAPAPAATFLGTRLAVNEQMALTEMRPTDKAALLKYLQDKDIYDRTLRIPYPYTEKDADLWLAQVAKSIQQLGYPVHWAIRDRDDFLIGAVGFDSAAIGKSHQAEIGYWLAKPYWGRGIISAAVAKACAFAFDEWGLVKITAHVFDFNTASARVLEKCGFSEEGYLKKHYFKDGQYRDARLYSLLK